MIGDHPGGQPCRLAVDPVRLALLDVVIWWWSRRGTMSDIQPRRFAPLSLSSALASTLRTQLSITTSASSWRWTNPVLLARAARVSPAPDGLIEVATFATHGPPGPEVDRRGRAAPVNRYLGGPRAAHL